MAKMQRKKPADQKKKKKQDAGNSAPGDLNSDQTAPSLVPDQGVAAGEKKKKSKPDSVSRRTAHEQTVLMRLLDRYFGKWIQFLREVKVELSKVTWPTRKETMATTAVVLVFVFIIAIFLGAVDFALSSIVRMIL